MAAKVSFCAAVLVLLAPISAVLDAAKATEQPQGFSTAAPRLGQNVGREELAPLAITVFPDGRGLPSGSGSAVEGAAVYARHCLACHGPGGKGALNDALVGGQGTLATATPKRTVGSFWPYATTLFDYVRRAMPYQAPGSLSNGELYAVTAYLLHANGIIKRNQVLDAASLPAVTMPNRGGFVWPLPGEL